MFASAAASLRQDHLPVPQTFIEVSPTSDTFSPFARHQRPASATNPIPFGDEEDNTSYAFQAQALRVPLSELGLAAMPCSGTRMDKLL